MGPPRAGALGPPRGRYGPPKEQRDALHLGRTEGGAEYSLPLDVFRKSGHLLAVGPTGVGKSKALELMVRQLIAREGSAHVVLDPKGSLYDDLKAWCYQHPRYRDRLVLIDPVASSAHGYVVGLDPMAHGTTPSLQACYAVELLRHVIGNEAFLQGYRMLRWLYNTFLPIAAVRLTMREASALVTPGAQQLRPGEPHTYSDLRRAIAYAVPDEYAEVRSDWLSLADREARHPDIIDEFLGSSANRLREYTRNEHLRQMLSTTEHVVDWREVFDGQKIVLVNLSRRGLTDADQRMLGMQIAEQVIQEAFRRKVSEAVPCYLWIDEFHHYVSPRMALALDEGRGLKLRLVVAVQYASQLIDAVRQDFRLYQSVLQNCRTRIVFGGLVHEEATRMAQIVGGPHLDPYRVKDEIYRTYQTSSLELRKVYSSASMSGFGETRGSASGGGSSEGERAAVPDAWFAPSEILDRSSGVSSHFATTIANFSSGATADAVGDTWVNVPSALKQELSSREFMALDEQLWEFAARMATLENRWAFIQEPGNKKPVLIRTGDVRPSRLGEEEIHAADAEHFSDVPLRGPDPPGPGGDASPAT